MTAEKMNVAECNKQ